jgi:hypothetical protein
MGLTRGLTEVVDRGSVNRAFVDNTTSSELTILQAPPRSKLEVTSYIVLRNYLLNW